MGWSISHGNSIRGTNYRSGTAMYEVGQHVVRIVTPADWRDVERLFYLANHADGPFSIQPRKARRMAEVLRAAAEHRSMSRDLKEGVEELADAADRAADARQRWKWR